MIFVNIGLQSPAGLKKALEPYNQRQAVFLFKEEQSRQEFDTTGFDYELTCLNRPMLPSTLRTLLFQPESLQKAMGDKSLRDLKAAREPTQDGLMEAIQQNEQQTALPPTTANPASGEDIRPKQALKPKSIPVIVVEDNRINRKTLVQYLKKMSKEAGDGEEAIEVFLEINEACIAITALNGDEYRERGLNE
ncbi:hypothetical protein QFC21_007039 [Naganishia friedmannii]|uniref:Uncharacterized protein n=1 Tax=Naganishia friedmannii TaxID=89922 RepID=A0ACC2UYV2_9TREE|nr:hypothetical protein QFC21_007039 [Naganishia friedmannii]